MGKETFRYLNVTLYAWALALSTDIKIGNLAYFVPPPLRVCDKEYKFYHIDTCLNSFQADLNSVSA